MPSQEEYLDNLLKNAMRKLDEESDAAEDDIDYDDLSAFGNLEDFADPELESELKRDNGGAEDLSDALSSMSEDDIDRLLAAGAGGHTEENAGPGGGSGRNAGSEENLTGASDRAQDGQEPLDAKQQRALEKKRKKQEKAEAKAAAKEKKAAEKAAAKAAKAAAKAGTAVAAAPETGGDSAPAAKGSVLDELFDSTILDSIVSGADQAGAAAVKEDVPDAGKEDAVDDVADLLGDLVTNFNYEDLISGQETDSADQSDGDGGDSAFPDFAAVDTQEADALIPDADERKGRKKGLLSKILEFLTEEDEEQTENENLQLSEENRDILDDLDKEKAAGKKKKGKKAKGGGESGGKAKKPKKEKKPKKVKEPEPEPLIPERRLTFKRVLPVLLLAASLGVLIIVFVNASVDFTGKLTAREAFYAEDYQACYQNLYGKNLNETEQMMFGKSESILYINLWLREYEMFVDEGAEVEALDSLLQTVARYPKLYDYAVQWDAGTEVAARYQRVLDILLEKYGLTEEQAKEIAAVGSNREYTKRVVLIVQGEPFGIWDGPAATPTPETTPLQDVLPEEEEMSEGGFIVY